jgi:hypothetical protein
MDIRPAELRDAHGIAIVHVLSWQAAYRGIVPDEFLRALSIETREARWRELLSLTSLETWVAEVETRVVGWISFGRHATTMHCRALAKFMRSTYWRTIGRRELVGSFGSRPDSDCVN